MPNDIKIDRFCIHSMSICIVLFLLLILFFFFSIAFRFLRILLLSCLRSLQSISSPELRIYSHHVTNRSTSTNNKIFCVFFSPSTVWSSFRCDLCVAGQSFVLLEKGKKNKSRNAFVLVFESSTFTFPGLTGWWFTLVWAQM